MFKSCEKLKSLFESTFGDSIKSYFLDDPALIPFSESPALCVAPISTDIDILDTARDQWTYTIDIILIIDARRELKKYKQEVIGTRYLTETMEAKTSTGMLQANSILYVLRDNLKLGDNWYINNIGRIDYASRMRTTTVGEQWVVKEATLRLSVVRVQNRPRSTSSSSNSSSSFSSSSGSLSSSSLSSSSSSFSSSSASCS